MTARSVHPTAIVGASLRHLQGAVSWDRHDLQQDVALPERIYIGPYAIVGVGARLGEGVVIDAYCKVDPGAVIGANSLILYRGTVGVDARVGESCVIGGSVSENTIVGDRCRSFGKLIHTHANSIKSWDFTDQPEASPVLHDDTFVGHDALVIGGIDIGPRAYVCAGSTVTRPVPAYHIASGINRIVHYTDWPGTLRDNPLFSEVL